MTTETLVAPASAPSGAAVAPAVPDGGAARPRLRRMLAIGPRCPDCGGPLAHGEGCRLCPVCGHSSCA